MKKVFVFKTSVKTNRQIKFASKILAAIDSVLRVDFDPEDCDRIVRIESNKEIATKVINLFRANGLNCEELV
ncbi:hypothetical protein [Flavobacterium beibuense]|uniref:Uncharacterized protein n=1 Tax=Flavobacterium beibuense TaxID=657326 RepID=A0A444W7A2_9FLAO|nr:hypothetical protein [Flavobacterium beibuense]RYJ41757.1 hypothetical protein NU09_2682 [Flavobacterium beibuense]